MVVLEHLQEEASQSSSGLTLVSLYLTWVVPAEGFQESLAKTAASKRHE